MELSMSAEENKRLIQQFYEEVWHAETEPPYDRYLAPEAAEYREEIQRIRQQYPDIRFDFVQSVAEGESVVTRWRWRGTHAESGEQQRGEGVAIFVIRDGRILDRWVCTDPATAGQIGQLLRAGGR
jgi:predicted SnoaL-like aldol condensation-catalyzing enzyme